MTDLSVLHVGAKSGHQARRVAAIREFGIPSEHCYELPCKQGFWPQKWRHQAQGVRLRLQDSSASCIHLHGLYGELPFLFASQKDRPILGTAMGGDIYFNEQLERNYCLENLLRQTLQSCDRISAKSPQMARRLEALGVPAAKICLINWGVDTSLFKAMEHPKESLGIPKEAKVVLSPRLMGPLYRQLTIIEAFAQVDDTPHLVMVDQFEGAHPYSQSCRRRCEALGIAHRSHFIPLQDFKMVPKLYALSDIAISIPSSDGLPQSAYEALACECPIILSDLPHYRGVFPEDAGVFFSNVGVKALSQQIQELISGGELARKKARKGRAFVCAEASQRANLLQIQAIYSDLASSAPCYKRPSWLPFYLEPWERKLRAWCP